MIVSVTAGDVGLLLLLIVALNSVVSDTEQTICGTLSCLQCELWVRRLLIIRRKHWWTQSRRWTRFGHVFLWKLSFYAERKSFTAVGFKIRSRVQNMKYNQKLQGERNVEIKNLLLLNVIWCTSGQLLALLLSRYVPLQLWGFTGAGSPPVHQHLQSC